MREDDVTTAFIRLLRHSDVREQTEQMTMWRTTGAYARAGNVGQPPYGNQVQVSAAE